jgi:hypothetical protein
LARVRAGGWWYRAAFGDAGVLLTGGGGACATRPVTFHAVVCLAEDSKACTAHSGVYEWDHSGFNLKAHHRMFKALSYKAYHRI